MSADVIMFRFQLREGQQVQFSAGQYLILFVPQLNGTPARRLFSINTPPSETNEFELLVKIIPGGVASEYLFHLKNIEEVVFQGPAGMFGLKRKEKPVVFLATGTGLAPIRSILLSSIKDLQSVRLFWGLRASQDSYYVDEFESLKKQNPHFSYTLCFSRDETFETIEQSLKNVCTTGRVPDVMENKSGTGEFAIDNNSDYYLCGGRLAVETFREYLYKKGVEKTNVFFEKF